MSFRTKEKILTAALLLFNKKGLSEVTTRQITIHLDISQGHLTYYFQKRAALLEALYGQFQDQYLILLKEPVPDLYLFNRWLDTVLEIQYTYRFLFLDFAEVMRESPKIKKQYFKLREIRKKKLEEILILLTKQISETQLNQIELLIEFGMMYGALDKKPKRAILAKVKEDIETVIDAYSRFLD